MVSAKVLALLCSLRGWAITKDGKIPSLKQFKEVVATLEWSLRILNDVSADDFIIENILPGTLSINIPKLKGVKRDGRNSNSGRTRRSSGGKNVQASHKKNANGRQQVIRRTRKKVRASREQQSFGFVSA